MPVFASSHSEAEYARYLSQHLPEYALDGAIPAPGKGADSAIRLRMVNPSMAVFGAHHPPIVPKQPDPLIITGNRQGKKRLADIKHFVNKRNKLVALLQTDPQAREQKFFLKRYDSWDNFTVGRSEDDTIELRYQHMASLKRDLEKHRGPLERDWFLLRRFFHNTTPEQKQAMIEKYLRDHGDYYYLDEFKGKNDFWIAPRNPELKRSVGRVQLHSFTALRQHFGEPTGLMRVFNGLVRRIIASEREERLAREIARIRALVPEADRIYVQRDTLQRDFATIQHSVNTKHGSTFHNLWKSIRQKIIGPHVRTHPWRRYKVLTDALIRPLGRVHTRLSEVFTKTDPIEVGTEIMTDAVSIVQQGRTIPAASMDREEVLETNPGRHEGVWQADLGFGQTAGEMDLRGWERIESSIESLGMHERNFKGALNKIGAGVGEGRAIERPSCQDVHDVLYSHAKILFHIQVMRKEFRERHAAFRAMQRNIREGRQTLEQSEDLMKQALVDVLSVENEAYELIKEIDLRRYNLVSQLKSEGERADVTVASDVDVSPGADRVEEFVGPADGMED